VSINMDRSEEAVDPFYTGANSMSSNSPLRKPKVGT
jgi:hypothetical protein